MVFFQTFFSLRTSFFISLLDVNFSSSSDRGLSAMPRRCFCRNTGCIAGDARRSDLDRFSTCICKCDIHESRIKSEIKKSNRIRFSTSFLDLRNWYVHCVALHFLLLLGFVVFRHPQTGEVRQPAKLQTEGY